MFEEEGESLINLFDESQCNFKDTSHLKVNKYKPTDELTVKRIYLLGRIISKIFKDHGLQYWVTGGTLLGCVRHRGLIPWDDDIDICVLDEEKLLSLKNVFIENSLELQESFTGYRFFHQFESDRSWNPVDNEHLEYRQPFCDVFPMRENVENGRIEPRSGRSRTLWPNEWYVRSDLESMKEMLYGDFYFKTINNPLSYLHRTYGDDCLDVGWTQDYDHQTREWMQTERVPPSIGFHPAKPFR